jgi:antitoxin PrlF
MLESVITAKAQTTLPKGVRVALGVSPGDRLAYVIERDHAIIMRATHTEPEDDPAMTAFLTFIERDLCQHPEHLRDLPQPLLDRARALVGMADVDVDAPIEGEVAI